MMKGDSGPFEPLTARGFSGAPARTSASVAQRLPETQLHCNQPENTNGRSALTPNGRHQPAFESQWYDTNSFHRGTWPALAMNTNRPRYTVDSRRSTWGRFDLSL